MNGAQSHSGPGADDLTELQNLQLRYVDVIQNLKSERTKQDEKYMDLRTKYDRLKGDFMYNIQLLQGRDAELVVNENAMRQYNIEIGAKEKELSDLKVQLDQMSISRDNEAKARQQLQIHYQQRIREKQKEVEEYRRDKDVEITQERNNLEIFKRNLERQVKELEEELDLQQRQLTTDFDEAAKKREHEFRVQIDELSNTVLGHEIKVKLLTKELELAKAAHETDGKEMRNVRSTHQELEKQLKRREWEMEEIKALRDVRISELEEKVSESDERIKQLEDDFMRKHLELDQALRRKDVESSRARELWVEREAQLLLAIESLTEKSKESEAVIRQLQWNLQDAIKEKGNVTEKFEAEISDIKARWERHVAEISHDSVTKVVHMSALHEAEEAMKDELLRRKQDIERYKKDLVDALERESALERAKVQADLDWQRRCEELERLNYQRSEDLVKNLTKSRDEALATVEEQKLQMEKMEKMVKMLQKERDQALSMLTRHGLKIDHHIEVPIGGSVSEIASLREQNQKLQMVIKQMKDDMESLTTNIHSRPDSNGQGLDAGYVRSLEEDLSALRIKCRELELRFHDLETIPGSSAKPLEDQLPFHDNAAVNAHLEQLNNAISVLRKEKVDLTAQLRKQQTTAMHLQGRIDQLSKQPMEKQLQIDQLHYELNACKRRSETEVLSLRQRISDLELQVTEARKEADEYYRANTESNMEVTALANQVSQLKLDLASANPSVNFGAQELVIQQLEDVITRQSHHPASRKTAVNADGEGQGETVDAYKERLKMAVKDLIQIAKKNKVLTEINNRLLSEMARNGIRPSSMKQPLPIQHQHSSAKVNQSVQNKLQQLEELQYQITRQELALRGRSQGPSDQINALESDETELHSILKKPVNHLDYQPGRQKSPLISKNESPSNFQLSNSSLGGESLQEIWGLISDNAVMTPSPGNLHQNAPAESQRVMSADSWMVTGAQPPITQKQNSNTAKRKQNMSSKAQGRLKPQQRHKPVVANYNRLRGSTDSL